MESRNLDCYGIRSSPAPLAPVQTFLQCSAAIVVQHTALKVNRRLAFAALFASAALLHAATLELKPNDHLCLIGNALAERMQHDNQWETLLHQRFPKHQLAVRNLGWSADEVDIQTELPITGISYAKEKSVLKARPRSMNFGSPDQHLTHSKADVVLAFFGFNESFAGDKGLAKFSADLDALIAHTLKQNYSVRGAPRLVLVSPIAHENVGDPNLPDGKANNANLARYTAALAAAAKKGGVGFVDLFTPTAKLFAGSKPGARYTMNGVHLNELGHAEVAKLLDAGLFGATGAPKQADPKLRAEIAEKNYQWFNRYRAVNGYYIYGERSKVKFADGEQSNADVMERERQILDVMTANRDARIWKIAQGQSVPAAIDDSNVPPFLPVKTYYGTGMIDKLKAKGAAAQGMSSKSSESDSITYLSPEEGLTKFKLAPGYKIEVFASEVQFPEIANAVQMTFDAKGRLWICTMPSYPQYQPLKHTLNGKSRPDDKIVILEDTNGDGKADKSTIFARGLHVPTGLEFANGGVIVGQEPDLVLLKDTNGDDQADTFERVLHGFDSADSHHAIHAFTLGPGGELYMGEGTFFYSQVETPHGPLRNHYGAIYRFEPRTWKLDAFVAYNFANPWGIAFDRWGQTFIADASGGAHYYGTAFSGRMVYPDRHKPMAQWFPMRMRPTAGCTFVSSRHFPEAAQGNYLFNNVIGFQGTFQHKVTEKGSGFEGTEIEPLLTSTDRNFRPVDLEFAPDGSLYIVDWHEPLIGHLQYSLRDPQRDNTHGRIYRITYPSRPLVKAPNIAGAPIEKLFEALKEPENQTRRLAKLELSNRKPAEVLAALPKWMTKLDPTHKDYPHHLLEALWTHQYLNVVNEDLLKRLLRSPEANARAAAVRVLCYWRDRVKDPLGLLATLVKDGHPRVRLEAVRALSFFDTSKAAEIALEVLNLPDSETDTYIKYTLDETLRTLEQVR